MSLLIFGMGYTARALLDAWPADWPRDVTVTTRSREKARALARKGLTARIFPGDDVSADLARARRILITAGPEQGHDPVLARLRDEFAHAAHPDWVGYLSTTGVYGDRGGAWVDEDTPLRPTSARGEARVTAEEEWRALHRDHGLPVHVFRLAGIYGPGRSAFDRLRDGTARRILKPGQVFSRVHVEDIAQVLLASMRRPDPGAVYNVCDDEPAPPQDVIAHAAELLGVPVPPDMPFEAADLGPMARSFYADNKRVRNDRIKSDLGVRLRYPDYRAGLAGILARESLD
jgi:nucleoside-diphosphate-sugar epimerase